MSLLGFDKTIKQLKATKRKILKECMDAAQDQWKVNFQSEGVDGQRWPEVKRNKVKFTGPILQQTRNLIKEAIKKGNVVYTSGSAILTVDPIDQKTGVGYASYHQEGDGRGGQKREYMKQTNQLTNKQESIIMDNVNNAF